MKICSVIGCNNPVWGKGVCQKHTPKKPLKKTGFKYTPVYKVGAHITKELLEDVFTDLFYGKAEKRNAFFKSIWAKRPHVCQHCGKKLGNEPRTYMFDHLLEKQKYKNLEYEEENIWLVCLECHDEKSRGIITEKYREKINFVSTKFNVS